jgi:serine/threonine protein kinase
MGRECAVKVLPLHRVTDETLAGFKREIRMQAKLDCPYLVRAHDAGQDGSVHYLVTEYVAGMDLRKLVKTRGVLSQEEAAGIIMQAALGLAYAHEEGLIHRDVKPANILVTPESVAKVSDVGLAGFAADLVDDPRAGKIVGTPDFISPEQYSTPLQVNPASDVYSLGCTLYYAVTGKAPFPGGDTASKIRRHLEATPLHPRNFNPNLSEEFVDIIADMMEKDPRKRIQTMTEVAARLEVWVTSDVPMLDAAVRMPVPDESVQDTSFTSGTNSINRPQSTGTAPPPPQMQFGSEPKLDTAPWSKGMLVGMTIAIVLPPTLVIGMMLGFMIAKYF